MTATLLRLPGMSGVVSVIWKFKSKVNVSYNYIADMGARPNPKFEFWQHN